MPTSGTQLQRATAKAAFWQSFETQPDIMGGVTHQTTSDADQETYPFLSAAPSPIEMEGSRIHKSVPEISYAIVNKKWESTLDITYEMMKNNKLGQIAATSAELGVKARQFPQKRLSTLLNNGHTTAGPDTQNFFDTDHSDPGAAYTTNQDNDLTKQVADNDVRIVTDAEWAAMIRSMRDAFLGFLDGQGDPVAPSSDTVFELHVPAQYVSIAQRIEKVDQLSGPTGNDVKGVYRTIFNPWLTAASSTVGTFFMLNPGGARKPLIQQTNEAVSFETGLGTDFEKETKDTWIGTFAYGNTGYGDWRYAVRMGTTT